MRPLFVILLLCTVWSSFAQMNEMGDKEEKRDMVYLELAGRGYFSINYERAWREYNRFSLGFGWNHMSANVDSLEAREYSIEGDHESFPYLLLYTQYSRLFGKKRSHLELGGGAVYTLYDMARMEFAQDLDESESYIAIYPVIGYRFEGEKGFVFMFTLNPLIQLPQGYFWPIPGISAGYKF